VATDYYAPPAEGEPARIRAWASYDADRLAEGPGFAQIGQGYFAVLLDQGEGSVPYQGITPLSGGSLSACAETYFAQSEQLPTRFALAFGRSRMPGRGEHWRAGGVMMQHMPKASPLMAVPAGGTGQRLVEAGDLLQGDAAENWNRVTLHLATVEDIELVGPSVQPTELLVRLFHEEAPRVFDPQGVKFGCSCSAQKVRDSLSIYSAKDIATMTTEAGIVTADCQFCGAHYEFDPKTVGFEAQVRAEEAGNGPGDGSDNG
jgi:molecular chaperone Hsp33